MVVKEPPTCQLRESLGNRELSGCRRSVQIDERRHRCSASDLEKMLADLAHLDLFGSFGDSVAAVMAVDVLERHMAAVADATAGLHGLVGGIAGKAVRSVVAHRHEVGDIHVVMA